MGLIFYKNYQDDFGSWRVYSYGTLRECCVSVGNLPNLKFDFYNKVSYNKTSSFTCMQVCVRIRWSQREVFKKIAFSQVKLIKIMKIENIL